MHLLRSKRRVEIRSRIYSRGIRAKGQVKDFPEGCFRGAVLANGAQNVSTT